MDAFIGTMEQIAREVEENPQVVFDACIPGRMDRRAFLEAVPWI